MTKAGNSLPPEEMGRVEDMTGTPRRHAEEVEGLREGARVAAAQAQQASGAASLAQAQELGRRLAEACAQRDAARAAQRKPLLLRPGLCGAHT